MRYLLAVVAVAVVLAGASIPANAEFKWEYGVTSETHSAMPGDVLHYTGHVENFDGWDNIYVNSWELRTPGSVDWASAYGIKAVQPWDSFVSAFRYGEPVGHNIRSSGSMVSFRTNEGHYDTQGEWIDVITPVGTYTADLVLKGGSSASSTDELYTFPLTIEIVADYGFQASLKNPDQACSPGSSVYFAQQWTNSSNRTIYNTCFSTSFDAFDQGPIAHKFTYDWPSEIGAGQTLEADVIRFNVYNYAGPSMNSGTSSFHGGYYQGDYHEFKAGHWSLQVVPEPGSLLAMSAGLLSLAGMRLRRK